ncbi:MAG: TIGR03943 family protein [Anaerolineae bacterium]|nr:TIGR03943 family protein [Anaerolineae bacterium]
MAYGLKGLVMLALAYFLFSRITNGTLFFYINNRFAWLTFLAVIGFFAVALGYLAQARLVRQMLEGGHGRRLGAPGSPDGEGRAGESSSHARGQTAAATEGRRLGAPSSPDGEGCAGESSSHARGQTAAATRDRRLGAPGSPDGEGRAGESSSHAHGQMAAATEDRRLGAPSSPDEEGRDHEEADHDHEYDHGHSHRLSRVGLALVLLPVVLGLLVPARPLGAGAVGNREVSVGRLSTAAAPRAGQVASPARAKNLLDWLMAFDQAQDPAAFDGQPANLLGFVYRDSRFGDDSFLLSRFVVSCCVADATPIGLVVRTPNASQLALDQWVQVSGHFQAGEFDGHPMPILVADVITPTVAPNQPYLFP